MWLHMLCKPHKNVTVFVFLLKSILKVKKVARLTACNITVWSREPAQTDFRWCKILNYSGKVKVWDWRLHLNFTASIVVCAYLNQHFDPTLIR